MCRSKNGNSITHSTRRITGSNTTRSTKRYCETTNVQSYTGTEVSNHTTKDDCWLILDGGVYDVTSFIPRHPGGDKILKGCGKDTTQMFAKHPDSAKAMKEQFKIGDLGQ